MASAVGNGATPRDCIYEFARLPIAENLSPETAGEEENKEEEADLPATVFQDDSNPLLSQIAIFARLLQANEEPFALAQDSARKTRG